MISLPTSPFETFQRRIVCGLIIALPSVLFAPSILGQPAWDFVYNTFANTGNSSTATIASIIVFSLYTAGFVFEALITEFMSPTIHIMKSGVHFIENYKKIGDLKTPKSGPSKFIFKFIIMISMPLIALHMRASQKIINFDISPNYDENNAKAGPSRELEKLTLIKLKGDQTRISYIMEEISRLKSRSIYTLFFILLFVFLLSHPIMNELYISKLHFPYTISEFYFNCLGIFWGLIVFYYFYIAICSYYYYAIYKPQYDWLHQTVIDMSVQNHAP